MIAKTDREPISAPCSSIQSDTKKKGQEVLPLIGICAIFNFSLYFENQFTGTNIKS